MIERRRSLPKLALLARVIFFLVAAAIALSSLPGCCGCCGLLPDPRKNSGTNTSPTASPTSPTEEPVIVGPDGPIITTGSLVNLGIVAYPTGTPPAGAAMHVWDAPKLRPAAHKLGYALGADERRAIEDDFNAYAREVRYKSGDKRRFLWIPPKGCTGDMRCVLERLASRSRDDIAPIVERFKKRAREAKLNSMDAATILVGFVQAIPYEVPKDEPFGVLPPARVAFERRGDCDSKALLGHMLLASLGVESVIISSEAHKHAMLGIALPTSGKSFTHAGTRYAYAETTAKGSPIGHINPELLSPNDWRVVPIRISGGADASK